jgi:transglutaminase-like putative cysteine protease
LNPIRKRLIHPDDMRKLREMNAKADRGAVSPRIVKLARKLVKHLPSDAYWRRAQLLHDWVRRCVKYEHDPDRREYIETPDEALDNAAADCDGKVVLAVSLARALGMDAAPLPVIGAPDITGRPRMRHVQWGVTFPGSNKVPVELRRGGRIVGELTVKNAQLGRDPLRLPRNPETGRPYLQ